MSRGYFDFSGYPVTGLFIPDGHYRCNQTGRRLVGKGSKVMRRYARTLFYPDSLTVGFSHFLDFASFLAGLFVFVSASIFFGRPLPGTLRIISNAELSYSASLVMGFIFATKSLCKTAFLSMPSSLAISLIVIPVIVFISVNIQTKLDFFNLKVFTTRLCRKNQKTLKI
jgi:hypothetical protein